MSEELIFISGNDNKVREIARLLEVPLARQALDLPEIQSLELETVVEEKARAAYAKIGARVLVEDSALRFHALGKLPGTYIKWFLDEIGPAGLCRILHDYDDRTATAMACFGLCDGETIQTFLGSSTGTIAQEPRQGEGFGFDFIFIPEGYDHTWSELGPQVKDQNSHRSRAVDKLKDYLSRTSA